MGKTLFGILKYFSVLIAVLAQWVPSTAASDPPIAAIDTSSDLGMSPLMILQQPAPSGSCSSGTTSFSIQVTGDPPISYQWQAELEPNTWTDLLGGAVFHNTTVLCAANGGQTADLSIDMLGHFLDDRPSMNLRCIVSNPSNSITSQTAALTVYPAGSSDANNDGKLDARDLILFVSSLRSPSSANQQSCAFDTNADGWINDGDIPGFVTRLLLWNDSQPAEIQFPYSGNHYYFDSTPGDNDLPWLRQYATDHGIFNGINMSAEWRDREWEMIKAIIYYTSHTLRFVGVNTDPLITTRAKAILSAALEQPDYGWGCGEIAQVAIGLAQAHGIQARAINGRDANDPCVGDYCCEMYSTRFKRWVFLMPHVNAWIEHETDGPLGVRELRQYDLAGRINANLISEAVEQLYVNGIPVFDGDGNPIMITIPMHFEAIASPPLKFMPSTTNIAPIEPYMTINWWSGFFHRVAISYTTTMQQENPIMLEVFNDELLNQTACAPIDPIPVVTVDDPNLTYPLNTITVSSAKLPDGLIRIRLQNAMIDFDHYEIKVDAGSWQTINLPFDNASESYIWQPTGQSTLTIRGITLAGVTSPEVIVHSAN